MQSTLQFTSLCTLALSLSATPVCAADALPGDDLRQYLPSDLFVSGHVLDIERSKERWLETPYFAIWQSDLFAHARAEAEGELQQQTETDEQSKVALEAIQNIKAASFALSFPEAGIGEPDGILSVRIPEAIAAAEQFAAASDDEYTQLETNEILQAWQSAIGLLAANEDTILARFSEAGFAEKVAAGETLFPLNPTPDEFLNTENDIEFTLSYAQLNDLMASMPMLPPEQDAAQQQKMIEMMQGMKIGFGMSLQHYGIREEFSFLGEGQFADMLAAQWAAMKPAKPEVLASLPANTLWAFTLEATPAVIDVAVEMLPDVFAQNNFKAFDEVLIGIGLPPYLDLIKSMDGTILLYSTEPFMPGGIPNFTLQIPFPAEVGQAIINYVKTTGNGKEQEDGTLSGSLMIIPWQLAYQDGYLIATTDPLEGIKGHFNRQPGFMEQPAAANAAREIPDGALAIGISRSKASWQSLANVGKPMLMGMAGFALEDLTALDAIPEAAEYGFYSISKEGTIASGGMLSSSIGGLGIGAAGAALWWQTQMMKFQQDMQQFPGEEDFGEEF